MRPEGARVPLRLCWAPFDVDGPVSSVDVLDVRHVYLADTGSGPSPEPCCCCSVASPQAMLCLQFPSEVDRNVFVYRLLAICRQLGPHGPRVRLHAPADLNAHPAAPQSPGVLEFSVSCRRLTFEASIVPKAGFQLLVGVFTMPPGHTAFEFLAHSEMRTVKAEVARSHPNHPNHPYHPNRSRFGPASSWPSWPRTWPRPSSCSACTSCGGTARRGQRTAWGPRWYPQAYCSRGTTRTSPNKSFCRCSTPPSRV